MFGRFLRVETPYMLLNQFGESETIMLGADPDEVFALLVDVDRLPAWNRHVHRVIERPDGPLAPGAEWVIEMRAMGWRWPSRARATVVDPVARRFEHVSMTDDGNPSRATWTWHVSPCGDESRDGSQLTVTWLAQPKTLLRRLVLARVRRSRLHAEVRASLAAIDGYLTGARTR